MKTIVSQETTQTRTDIETGEIVEETTSKTFVIKNDNEPFFVTYVKGLSIIYGITSAAALRLLYKLLELSNFNNPEVQITAPKKKEILNKLQISEPCFTKAMKILIDKKLVEGSRGLYTISLDIFWKGDTKTRQKLMYDQSQSKITIEPNTDFDKQK